MRNNEYNLKYNSCVSRGICSLNPRISALQNVLVLYLHLCAKYCLKLYDKSSLDSDIKQGILNTTAISIANPEFTENCFMEAIINLKTVLLRVIEKYNSVYKQEDFKNENICESEVFKKCETTVDAIKFGESIFRESSSRVSDNIRNLYKIMLITAKSVSINLLDLESFGGEDDAAFKTLLKLIDSISSVSTEQEDLKSIIYEGAVCNTNLMTEVHNLQEKTYGRQGIYQVSYTTKPSKAVLVVGSNIKELEIILEALKNEEIDVYTHDDMMVAHTFPKFKEYKNLKGQYGHGIEHCLIDFATFPGPIILTSHSLHNAENLYRGRLFTTDKNYFKGIVKIEDNNFMPVIKAAKESKGFKRGKECETVEIGYDYEKCTEIIDTKAGGYKKFVVIGLKDDSGSRRDYFAKLVKLIDKNTLIVSFSYNFEQENFLHFNTCFDSFAVVRIFQYLLKYNLPLCLFLPKCRQNTVAEILHFRQLAGVNVFLGECEPVMINPSLMNTLQEIFGIKIFGSPGNDSEFLNKL